MIRFFKILAVLSGIGGGLGAIISGVVTQSFWTFLIAAVGAVISAAVYSAIAELLENQEELLRTVHQLRFHLEELEKQSDSEK